MCGRYALSLSGEQLELDFLEEAAFPDLELPWANYNIAPTSRAPIVTPDGRWAFARWGLLPSWAKEAPRKPLFNARLETASEKPSFRQAYRRGRCLVPATGFFEWTKEAARKQPYFFPPEQGANLLWMAGLASLSPMENPQGEWTYAVLTTESAGSAGAEIHHRRPVLLRGEARRAWLTNDEAPPTDTPYSGRPHRVTPRVNSIAANSLENLEPWQPTDTLF